MSIDRLREQEVRMSVPGLVAPFRCIGTNFVPITHGLQEIKGMKSVVWHQFTFSNLTKSPLVFKQWSTLHCWNWYRSHCFRVASRFHFDQWWVGNCLKSVKLFGQVLSLAKHYKCLSYEHWKYWKMDVLWFYVLLNGNNQFSFRPWILDCAL